MCGLTSLQEISLDYSKDFILEESLVSLDYSIDFILEEYS